MTRVRLASDLAVGDEVLTLTRRPAKVKGFECGAVLLETFDGEELQLLPHLLTLVRKAPPRRSLIFRDAATAAGV